LLLRTRESRRPEDAYAIQWQLRNSISVRDDADHRDNLFCGCLIVQLLLLNKMVDAR
jgi:hypothetical protein